MRLLDTLERQIVAVLQVDARCSWRKAAAVLGESERTVSRKGGELLDSGMVSVCGIRPKPAAVVVEMTCSPGTARAAAQALAQRPDTTFAYTVTGSGDCVAEVLTDRQRLGTVLAEELPATIGLTHATSYPVLRYFRTIRGWQPQALSTAQVAALQTGRPLDPGALDTAVELGKNDDLLVEALCADGRTTFEALARRIGVSEATARRRTEWLLETNQVELRVIVEPAALGLPVEALLWIRATPRAVGAIGAQLAALPQVRYAAAIAGDYQIVADVTLADASALYRFVTESAWAAEASSVDTSVLLEARKRGGKQLRPPTAW
jgi:Lrp/AsnC family transcriptional regulator for asnA, asnC and gidA